MANGKIETYEESARAIALWLKKFCDYNLPYPEMIANATRRASAKIERLLLTNDKMADRCDLLEKHVEELSELILSDDITDEAKAKAIDYRSKLARCGFYIT